jgi:hypothetical protein
MSFFFSKLLCETNFNKTTFWERWRAQKTDWHVQIHNNNDNNTGSKSLNSLITSKRVFASTTRTRAVWIQVTDGQTLVDIQAGLRSIRFLVADEPLSTRAIKSCKRRHALRFPIGIRRTGAVSLAAHDACIVHGSVAGWWAVCSFKPSAKRTEHFYNGQFAAVLSSIDTQRRQNENLSFVAATRLGCKLLFHNGMGRVVFGISYAASQLFQAAPVISVDLFEYVLGTVLQSQWRTPWCVEIACINPKKKKRLYWLLGMHQTLVSLANSATFSCIHVQVRTTYTCLIQATQKKKALRTTDSESTTCLAIRLAIHRTSLRK